MKKVLALVLAMMLVVGMAPTVFGAVGAITFKYGTSYTTAVAITGDDVVTTSNHECPSKPGELRYYLMDGTTPITKADVTKEKISLQVQKVQNYDRAIDNITIDYDKSMGAGNNAAAFIKVTFKDELLSTSDFDYTARFYLVVNGKKEGILLEVNGNIKNATQKPNSADYDYLYSKDQPQIEPTDYIKGARIYAGDGVIINANLFQSRKYYARASTGFKSEDDQNLNDYPDIEAVYYLKQINFNSSANTVTLEDLDKSLFVYDGDLNFLGMGNEKLPVVGKYYVSSKELDTGADEAPEAPSTPSEPSNPAMGGNDVPANINDNPGTGR